jgi:hypothetical protein
MGDRCGEFVVADVARRADISAGQIYRWRQEVRTAAAADFTPALIAWSARLWPAICCWQPRGSADQD